MAPPPRPDLPTLARDFNAARRPFFAQFIVTLILTVGLITLQVLENMTSLILTDFGVQAWGIQLNAVIQFVIFAVIAACIVLSLFTLRQLVRSLNLREAVIMGAAVAVIMSPATAFITSLALIILAARKLRHAGARAGLLHAVSPADIARLQQRWCPHCGYHLAGLPDTTPCPECGKH